MPDVEMWTTNSFEAVPERIKQTRNAVEASRIKRIGINLGAPGNRRDDTGTLWLEYPVVGGESPKIPIRSAPDGVEWFYRHSSRIEGAGLKWVAASGARGISDLSIELLANAKDTKRYIVRLYFSEPDSLMPGQRLFDVSIQGNRVLNGFDISKEAGGPNRIVVREFKGINVKDILTIHLLPSFGSRIKQTILCGVEIIADGW